jgi:hypothetical protein
MGKVDDVLAIMAGPKETDADLGHRCRLADKEVVGSLRMAASNTTIS